MQDMELIDEIEMPPCDNLPCPITDEEVRILMTANSYERSEVLTDLPPPSPFAPVDENHRKASERDRIEFCFIFHRDCFNLV